MMDKKRKSTPRLMKFRSRRMSNDEALMTNFKKRVLQVVKNIPVGETLTYAEVAEKSGRPGAARAVGNIMSRNFDPDIPCHRVIRSDGKLGHYNRGVDKKEKLLKAEEYVTNLSR